MYWKYLSQHIPSTIKFLKAMHDPYILMKFSSLFVSFKREDTMRFFQEMAFLLLPLLVAGQEVTLKFLCLASCWLWMFYLWCRSCGYLYMIKTIFIELYRRGTEDSWILLRSGNAMSLDNVRWVSTQIHQGLAWKLYLGCMNHGENLHFLASWRCPKCHFHLIFIQHGRAF